MRIAATLAIAMMLAGCHPALHNDRLVTAACPALTGLEDPSFGATTLKLIAVAGQYNQCRCAAVPKSCPKEK